MKLEVWAPSYRGGIGDGWKGEKASSWVAGVGIIRAGKRSWWCVFEEEDQGKGVEYFKESRGCTISRKAYVWMRAVEGRLQWGRERILEHWSQWWCPQEIGKQRALRSAEMFVLWCQKQAKCSGCSQPIGCPFCTCSRSVCRKLQSQVRKHSLPGLPHRQLLRVVSARSP